MSSPIPLAQLEAVELRIAGRVILQQIDLTLYPQEIVSLIGPNGAGKSSLVKIILGITTQSAGQISRLPNLRCAYVPQRFNPSLSLPLRSQDLFLDRPELGLYHRILDELDVEPLLSMQVHHLSGGERQRILLARALLRQPQLLVLDEPMQGLDINAEQALYQYVQKIPQQFGCAVLMISHDLQWVMQGTERVVCLNKHICCSGSPQSISQDPAYLNIFGKQRLFYQHQHDHCQHDTLPVSTGAD